MCRREGIHVCREAMYAFFFMSVDEFQYTSFGHIRVCHPVILLEILMTNRLPGDI